jgi:two-component system, NtrC family, response regulator HydG
MARILVIDDDAEIHEALRGPLRQTGHVVTYLDSAEDGLELLKDERFDVILLDNRMPRMTGLEFLGQLKQREVHIPVILLTGSLSDQTVIRATKMGAMAYVEKKDVNEIVSELAPEIDKAVALGKRHPQIPIPKPDAADDSVMIGGKRMREVFAKIGDASEGDFPVLILGETGTGKDLVAQAIHTNSARRDKSFSAINCAGFTESLLSDELFGHERGAFTGADRLRKGHFEHAHGGTIFLDEIGEMPLELQAKLLRVLQNGEIIRVGGNERIKVDVRVLAATHRNIDAWVSQGKFREDLYYRLEKEVIYLPPLRDRVRDGDVERLVARIISVECGDQPPPAVHADAISILRDHRWPGNIRQLKNVVERAVRKCQKHRRTQILPEDLFFGYQEAHVATEAIDTDEEAAQASLRRAIAWAWNSGRPDLWTLLADYLGRELLRHAIAQPLVSQDRLAKRLGVSKDTLRDLIKKFIPENEENAKADTEPDDDPCSKGIAILVTVQQKGEKISAIELARRMGVTRAQLYENAELARVREMGNKLFNLFSEKGKRGDYRTGGSKNKEGEVEAWDTGEDED